MPRVHPNRTADARHGVASRGESQRGAEHSAREGFADTLYAKAEFLGEFEGPCEALATIGELITRFGDEQNPSIRSTVIDAYLAFP
jgi:hypothetical protein